MELGVQQQAILVRELFFYRTDIFANYYYHKKREAFTWGPARERGGASNRAYNWAEADSHFNGKSRIGAYPHDGVTNTCKWIVADFDDNDKAYAQCRATYDKLKESGIVSHVERSKSGKGYHLWVFFTEAVEVRFARRVMKNVLHLAGVPITGKFAKGSNNDRSMDRLFPAADRITPQEMGNQVGLPYQGESVREGNTVFIDEDQQPIVDMWSCFVNCWNTRIDPNGNNIQDLHKMEFKEVDYALRQKSMATDEYWGFVGSLPNREIEMRGCEAIKASIADANQFSEPAWQDILSNIAVLGSSGQGLAHDVSRGYNRVVDKEDPMAQYDSEETDRKYFKKVERIQQGGFPSGCNKLSDNGWECPLLKTCEWKMIATFGVTASVNHYPPLATDVMSEIKELEDQGLYDRYMDILPSAEYVQIHIEKDRDSGKPAWIPIRISDLKILENLIGTREIMVRTYNFSDNTVKSIFQAFTNEEDANAFEDVVISHEFDYVRYMNQFWLLSNTAMDRFTAVGIVVKLMEIAEINVASDRSNISLSNFGLLSNEWALAPYHNQYVDVFVVFDIQ